VIWLRALIPILGVVVASFAWDAQFKREARLTKRRWTKARVVFVVALHVTAISSLVGMVLDRRECADRLNRVQTGESGPIPSPEIAYLCSEITRLQAS
jgi:hypothetical protein